MARRARSAKGLEAQHLVHFGEGRVELVGKARGGGARLFQRVVDQGQGVQPGTGPVRYFSDQGVESAPRDGRGGVIGAADARALIESLVLALALSAGDPLRQLERMAEARELLPRLDRDRLAKGMMLMRHEAAF